MVEFYSKIFISAASSLSLAVLTYLMFIFRNAIRYEETRFTFEVENHTDKPVIWDIMWDKQRLTIHAHEISGDKINDVRIFLNRSGKAEEHKVLEVKDSFIPLFDGEMQLRLASIVKTTFRKGTKADLYILTFILRRRRSFLRKL